jgi:hypothetical protein
MLVGVLLGKSLELRARASYDLIHCALQLCSPINHYITLHGKFGLLESFEELQRKTDAGATAPCELSKHIVSGYVATGVQACASFCMSIASWILHCSEQ